MDCFEKNLSAIETYDPALAARMRGDCPCSTVEIFAAKNGTSTCRIETPHGSVTVHSAYDPEKEAASLVKKERRPEAGLTIFLGLGLGYGLREFAREAPGGAKVIVAEAREALFLSALRTLDLAEAIEKLRPVFLVGVDATELEAALGRTEEPRRNNYCVIETPSLVRCDAEYYRMFYDALNRAIAPWIKMSEALRIVAFSGAGTQIPMLVEDVRDAFRQHGAETLCLSPRGEAPGNGLPEETRKELKRIVREFRPTFFFAADAGVFREDPEFFDALGTPVVAWFMDNPLYGVSARHAIANLMVFTWDRCYEEPLKALGFGHVAWLPLGTNPGKFHSMELSRVDRERYECDVSFVGDSVTDSAWEKMREGIGERWMRELLESIIEAHAADPSRSAMSLLEVKERDTGRQLTGVDRYVLCEMLEEHATGMCRRAAVRALSGFAPRVYGDDGWKRIEGTGAVVSGRVDYHTELPKIYAASRINLNVTKTQLRTTVNQRVFDAPACGGFVLTDYRSDLETLFDMDGEVAVYGNIGELAERAKYYLENEDERKRIAEAACRRVAACHTYAHRVETMLQQVREWM